MSALEQYFSNRENCLKDIRKAREVFGNVNTTEKEFDGLEKALSLMYVHCPLDLCETVLASIYEAGQRRFYFENIWRKQATLIKPIPI